MKPRPLHLVQGARTIGPGYGVSGPSWQLEKAFRSLGCRCERFTLDDLGIHTTSMPGGNRWIALLRFWRDIVVYSTLGTAVLWWRYGRSARPGTVVLCQVDALFGDIFVVRSLHKAFLKRQPNRLWMLLRNPLHSFVLLRDYIRFKGPVHRHFVALSPSNKLEIMEHYQLAPERITVIPNGVDMERFKPCRESRRAVRYELDLSAGEVVAIFAGHEFERKGLAVVLEALRLLQNRGVKISLVVAGRDCPESSRKQFPELEAQVRYIGNRNDMERYYAAADVMVMPTLHDVSPLVGPEALASGLPILMTPVGGANEYLLEGENGWFVRREPEDVAQKLEWIAGDRSLLERVSGKARASVEDLDWKAVAIQYLELMEKVL